MEIKLRCKAFEYSPVATYRIDVSEDRTFRVYDDVAGHFTTCHHLSASAKSRAWKETYGGK